MNHEMLDRYGRLDSPVHRIPAGAKLVLALGFVLGTILVPRPGWWWFGPAAVGLLVLAGLSRIPPWFLVRKFLLLEPVVFAVAMLALWQPEGFPIFIFMVTRSTLCLACMILLATTTPFSDLLVVLSRWHVPSLLVTTLALTYRYQFLLWDEAGKMKRARQSRSFAPSRGQVWRSLATVAAQLFIRSTERAERIYAAMSARGWRL